MKAFFGLAALGSLCAYVLSRLISVRLPLRDPRLLGERAGVVEDALATERGAEGIDPRAGLRSCPWIARTFRTS